jgi:ATP-binding cassette subfamily F protein 3
VELNKKLAEIETGDDRAAEEAREELSTRLGEVHSRLADMDAESGPARAAALLAGQILASPLILGLTETVGLGFSEADQHRPTKSFSGGWRCAYLFFLMSPKFLPLECDLRWHERYL